MPDTLIPTTVGGLRAIELQYRVIRNIATGAPAFFQSRTQLNTPGLGTLMPENFRKVADMSSQGTELFLLELTQAIQAHLLFTEREMQFDWLSVYMPVHYLQQIACDRVLMEKCRKYELPYNRLCFAMPETLLLEKDNIAAKTIRILHGYGFHFMLTNFGSRNSPVLRLADFPVDYVLLSPELTHFLSRDQRAHNAVGSVVSLVNDIGAVPIADGVMASHQAEMFHEFGCTYCAGDLAGKYLPEEEIRRNTDN
jgi:EAL domain-containing protein (putative c-di-GMP-specific phosphodiesterase class I)